MRSAVARPLGEAQVRLLRQIIDPFGRESPDRLRQPLRVVRRLDLLRNLRLRQLRRVQDVRLVLGQRPFERFLRAVNVDALPILPRGVEQRPDDARRQVGIFEFDVRRLHCKRRAVTLDQFLANRAGAETGNVFGGRFGQRQHRPDAMRRIPHRRQAGPIIRPTVHVLLMAGLEKLDFAQLPLFVEFLDVKKLTGIDHCLHHHVSLFRPPDEIHDFPAVRNAGGHGHGAGDVFAGLERGDGLM